MTHALLGTALGDCLGMPYETSSWFSTKLLDWDGDSFHGSSYLGLMPGQFTDDTQMSICLARSLIQAKGYNPAGTAKEYLAWFQSGKARGMGGSVMTAMESLLAGISPLDSGVKGSLGSGTAMRAVPLGVAYRGMSWQDLRDMSYLDARITHNSKEAEDASFFTAYIAWKLARGFPPQHNVEILPDFIRAPDFKKLIKRALTAATFEQQLELGSGGSCMEVVATGLAVLLHTKTFKEAIVSAIKLGGDTDTRAAIVGGWAGLSRPIPEEWACEVEDAAKLNKLDEQLWAVGATGP